MICLNRIYRLYECSNLSKNDRRILEGFWENSSEKVRKAAKDVYDRFCFEISKPVNDMDILKWDDVEDYTAGRDEYADMYHKESSWEDDEELPF
ncbi:MAG: hypothetical protein ACYDEQ_00070 [Desulfocucumaceae bacterium]